MIKDPWLPGDWDEEQKGVAGRDYKRAQGSFSGWMITFIILTVVTFTGVCVYIFVCQRTSLYTLNMYNILCQLYCNKAIKISLNFFNSIKMASNLRSET